MAPQSEETSASTARVIAYLNVVEYALSKALEHASNDELRAKLRDLDLALDEARDATMPPEAHDG